MKGCGWTEVSLSLLLSSPYRELHDIYLPVFLAPSSIDQPDVHYVGVSVSMRAYHGVPQTWLMFPSTTGMYLMNDLFSYQGSSAFFR